METAFKIAPETEGLGIPYPPRFDDGRNCAGYFDLKRAPEHIKEVYEIKGWPELTRCIKRLNRNDCFFRTLRCDVGTKSCRPGSVLTVCVESYVTVAFEILDINFAAGNYRLLWETFSRSVYSQLCRPESIVEFVAIPTSYNDHGIARAWSTDINVVGFGNNQTDARKEWACGLSAVLGYLVQESSKYEAELLKRRKTIS